MDFNIAQTVLIFTHAHELEQNSTGLDLWPGDVSRFFYSKYKIQNACTRMTDIHLTKKKTKKNMLPFCVTWSNNRGLTKKVYFSLHVNLISICHKTK